MRFIFVNDGDKEALLKRFYRRFQVGIATLIAALIFFILAFRAWVQAHGGLFVLVFTGLAVGFAMHLRSSRKRSGIEVAEWQSYLWRQPMMIVVSVIMAISVILNVYRVFFQK